MSGKHHESHATRYTQAFKRFIRTTQKSMENSPCPCLNHSSHITLPHSDHRKFNSKLIDNSNPLKLVQGTSFRREGFKRIKNFVRRNGNQLRNKHTSTTYLQGVGIEWVRSFFNPAAHRKPSQLAWVSGAVPLRWAVRTVGVLSIHPPPRNTRCSPVDGP